MHQAFQRGLVTKDQKAAVNDLNGHSSQIVQDYYLLTDQQANVAAAGKAFDKLYNDSTDINEDTNDGDGNDDNDDEDSMLKVKSKPVAPAVNLQTRYNDWGVKHPNRNVANNKRVKWSDEEIGYIRAFYYRTIKVNPEAEKTIVSRCLRAIQGDSKARAIFHRNHTLTSARLRHGYRIFQKELGIN